MHILTVCDNSSMLNTILFIKNIMKIIFIVVPLVLALLFTIDLAKNVFSKDDKDNLKLGIKRIIYSIVLMFVPLIVETFMSMISDYSKVAKCYDIATEQKVLALQKKEEAEYEKKKEEERKAKEEERQKAEEEKKADDEARKKAEEDAEKSQQEAAQDAGANKETSEYTPIYTKVDVPSKYIKKNGLLAEAGNSSNGTMFDNNPGDWKIKSEVRTPNLYYGGWTHVARFNDPIKANLMALCMESAAKNNHIGYDGNRRLTLYNEAKKYDFDVTKITKNVDTTCSNLVCVCINYTGTSFPSEAACSTGMLHRNLTKRSNTFAVKTYTGRGMTLYRGDILYSGHHTGVVL